MGITRKAKPKPKANKRTIRKKTIVFPPTFFINLDKRKDRLNEVQKEFKHWPVPIERVSGVVMKDGAKGCLQSHLKCIRLAKERDYPWVVILEDDCLLTPDAKDRMYSLLPYLWENRNQWDLFMGGISYFNKDKNNVVVINKALGIVKAEVLSAHFYIIHKAFYQTVLNNAKSPIDWYYRTKRIWISLPYITKQRCSKSNIGHNMANYYNAFSNSQINLMNILENERKQN